MSAIRAVRGLSSMGNGSSSMGSDGGNVMSSSSAPSYKGAHNAHGEPHGEGRRVFASGHVYEGQWVDGKCHGFGRFAYPDGQVFEGEWANGKRNGKGRLAMPSGEMIAGVWSDDALSGSVQKWTKADEEREQAARAKEAADAKKDAKKKRKEKRKKERRRRRKGGESGSESGSESSESESEEEAAEAKKEAKSPKAKKPSTAQEDEEQEKDVKWLRESHDVIWQLNVELQMENERLVRGRTRPPR